MKFKTIQGREVNKSITKWLVDWQKPCKSQFQFRVKQFFRRYWQYCSVAEEFPPPGTGHDRPIFIDLINFSHKIAVESDGGQHDKFNKFFHNNQRTVFLASIKRDICKRDWLVNNGYTLIQIPYKDEKLLSVKWIKDNFNIELN